VDLVDGTKKDIFGSDNIKHSSYVCFLVNKVLEMILIPYGTITVSCFLNYFRNGEN
jgi:hypothetical protein